MNTYTLAHITTFGPRAIEGIPRDMTKAQAEKLASKAMVHAEMYGMQVVAYNTKCE